MNTTPDEVRREYGLTDFRPRLPGGLEPVKGFAPEDERIRLFNEPGAPMMAVAHRADRNSVFPENSLEATENVILAGADIIESDVWLTADGVPVVMHDPTLTRTTDADRYIGRPGFPDTGEIAGWTFEQIRKLRLKYPSGEVTDYLVPALSDQMLLCRDRAFLTLDKHHAFDWDRDIYPLVKKTGAYSTVMVPYTYTAERAREIGERIRADGGTPAPFFADSRDDARIASSEEALRRLSMPAALRGTEYSPEDDAEWAARLTGISERGGKYYIETLNPAHDNEKCWRRCAELGCGWLMGNRIYEQIAFTRAFYGKRA